MPDKEWTIREAIEYGVKTEDKAIRFYATIMGMTKNPGSKQFLKEIIEYQKNHKGLGLDIE